MCEYNFAKETTIGAEVLEKIDKYKGDSEQWTKLLCAIGNVEPACAVPSKFILRTADVVAERNATQGVFLADDSPLWGADGYLDFDRGGVFKIVSEKQADVGIKWFIVCHAWRYAGS